MPKTVACLAVLAALVAGLVPALAEPVPAPLPADAVASVHGKVLGYRDLMAETVRRLGARSDTVLERLLLSHAIRAEAARRKVTVSKAEVDDYIANIERQAGGAEKLDAVLAKEGRSRAIFRKFVSLSLLAQKLAGADLGIEGSVPNAQIGIWRQELLKKLGAETDPSKLPAGVAARIAGKDITVFDFGEAIARETGDGILAEKVLEPWIAVVAIDQELAKQGVTVSDEEVEADLMRRKKEFESTQRARALKITFEQMLNAQSGRTLDDLRKDHEYRSVLGLRKLLATRVTETELKAWFEKEKGAFGETRRVQLIQIAFGRGKDLDQDSRSVAEARRRIQQLAKRLEGGEAWDSVATESDNKRRDPVSVTVASTGPPEIMAAIFAARPGDVEGPVKTMNAFTLLRVVEVLPPRTFEQVEDIIRKAVIKEREGAFLKGLRTDPGVVRSKRFTLE